MLIQFMYYLKNQRFKTKFYIKYYIKNAFKNKTKKIIAINCFVNKLSVKYFIKESIDK